MDVWEVPESAESLKSNLNIPGRGLRKIHPWFLETATWAWRIDTFGGQLQYGKFVEAMMNRIRFEESNPEEIRNFVNLMATDENRNFLRVAQSHIPELGEPCLHPNEHKNFQLSLLFQQLKKVVHERTWKLQDERNPTFVKYLNGLSKNEKALFEEGLFGRYGGPDKLPAMERLLKSTLELAFPQEALDHKIAEAEARGKDIERDSEGLPAYLLMPGQARDPRLWRLWSRWASKTSAGPSKSPASSAIDHHNEGLPCELLTPPEVYNGVGVSKGTDRLKQTQDNFCGKAVLSESQVPAARHGPPSRNMPEESEKPMEDSDIDFHRKRPLPMLEYLSRLPLIPGQTAPQRGPIYPKGMAPKVVRSSATNQSSNEGSFAPASPIKYINAAEAAEASKNQFAKSSSGLTSSESGVGQAVAASEQRLQRPPRRKSVQGMCPTVVVQEEGAMVTYASLTYRGR